MILTPRHNRSLPNLDHKVTALFVITLAVTLLDVTEVRTCIRTCIIFSRIIMLLGLRCTFQCALLLRCTCIDIDHAHYFQEMGRSRFSGQMFFIVCSHRYWCRRLFADSLNILYNKIHHWHQFISYTSSYCCEEEDVIIMAALDQPLLRQVEKMQGDLESLSRTMATFKATDEWQPEEARWQSKDLSWRVRPFSPILEHESHHDDLTVKDYKVILRRLMWLL